MKPWPEGLLLIMLERERVPIDFLLELVTPGKKVVDPLTDLNRAWLCFPGSSVVRIGILTNLDIRLRRYSLSAWLRSKFLTW